MCGITGIIGKKVDHHWLAPMMRRIAHRGPDGQGDWTNDSVSFGHLRLKIIDLSDRASQPMKCALSGNVLTFNGEIYNYRELKTELAAYYPFQTDSDTEVILAAWHHWGIQFLTRLRGMFAFALFIAAEGRVLLARDRFGIKPLYYRMVNGGLLFSSEIKGLLDLPGLTHTVNLKKVYGFLAHRHLDTDENTFFEEIKQLPASQYAWVNPAGEMLEPVEYWQIPNPGSEHFEEKDRAIFKEQLTESVRLHLRSDVPVGSFVSGGLDSSAIASLAWQILGKDYGLQTFSSILEEKNEENGLIDVMQAHLQGAEHHEIMLDGRDFLKEIPRITWHHDEPLADASMYAHWELCKLAQQNGLKVLLSGNGGDEVLGGYSSHAYSLLGRLLKNGRLSELATLVRIFNQNRPESVAQLIFRAVQEATPFALREHYKRFQGRLAGKLLDGAFTADDYHFYTYRNADPFTANLINNLRSWTVPPFLHYEDRNSMAFGVEIRVPMLDHQLFEFVMQWRPEDLLKGQSKSLLRTSLRGLVPDAVLDQKLKFGFAAPLKRFVTYDRKATFRFFLENVHRTPFLNQTIAIQLATEVLKDNNMSRFQYFWRVLSVAVWYNTCFNTGGIGFTPEAHLVDSIHHRNE